MTYPNIVKNPAHYTMKRIIQPIDVIESWSLCYHLACAVKCLAGAGRKNNIIEDLKKVKWYLSREINRYQEYGEVHHLPLGATSRIMVERIRQDWSLSDRLGEVLNNIRASKIPFLRESSLMEALQFLKAEIQYHELLANME